MARETQTKVINGCTYHVTQMQTKECRHVLRRLTVIGAILGALDEGTVELGAAAAHLASNMSDDDMDFLVDTFAKHTKVETPDSGGVALDLSNSSVIENHFIGPRLMDQFKWLIFATEVNFADFFGDIGRGGFTRPRPAPVEEPSPTQT